MSRSLTRLAAPALAALLLPAASAAHQSPGHRDFDIEAHRGGLAYRPESTLSSFGNAMRIGVTNLEYTIDDAPTMQRFIDLGVDGIISDDPLTLIAVAKQNGLR
jgi:glycerophosphoryl diester phosphodiesterase